MTVYSAMLGGLGNQMFQYAAARALALRLHADLRLDVSAYAATAMHQGFELQRIFNIQAGIAGAAEIRNVLGWQASPWVRRILVRPAFAGLRRAAWRVEPHFHYWEGLDKASGDCYLSGYWQSEKYFDEAEEHIRSEFAFKLPLSEQNQQLAEQIVQCNAVSLHVRRGDFVNHAKANAVHGTCTLEYYQGAIQYMAQHVAESQFYIFSDDMDWVRQTLGMDYPCHYIEHNRGAESYNDMRLMSLCKHHIIANSSFSWWGAWLNPLPQKRVIAPEQWFRHDHDTTDLYPAGWVKL